MEEILGSNLRKKDQQNIVIVRLRTTTWADSKGLHIKRSLTYLRRKCVGFNELEEDVSSSGAEQVITSIKNLNQCKDGIYKVVMCGIWRDWETGYIEACNYKLVPVSKRDSGGVIREFH